MTKQNAQHKTQERNVLTLLLKGKFAEAEILLTNHPHLRRVLLHLPGLRYTRFFKKRIQFYKHFAKKNKMAARFRAEGQKDSLRAEFAYNHCKINALKAACKKRLESHYAEIDATKDYWDRLNRKIAIRRRRRKYRMF